MQACLSGRSCDLRSSAPAVLAASTPFELVYRL